jgi:arabinogalactan oligomer/maltooligosaccharide transport system substrate-binding protein
MMTEGQAAAWWTGPWAIADLEAAGIDYAILPMGRPFVGIKTLMITRNAVDRDNAFLALDIMRYFTNEQNSTFLSLSNGTIPANTAALNNPQVQALESVAGFGASLNLGVPLANTPYSGAQWGPVADATTAIWFGTQTPANALAAAQRDIEAAIASMR